MALVIVMWILAVLLVMAGAYTGTMRTETLLTTQYVHQARARAAAEAGVWAAVYEVLRPEPDRTWRADNAVHDLSLGDGHTEVRIEDEAGRIDLNIARAELLHSLIQSVGVDNADSIRLLQAILDWRDRDPLTREAGAEDKEYRAAGLDYGAKDGPFNTLRELHLVLGMTDEIYQALLPAVTVYSHQPGLNPQVAQRPALLALPGVSEALVDDYLASREASPSGTSSVPLTGVDERYLSQASGRVIRITSAGASGPMTLTVEAVIILNIKDKTPYTIVDWEET